MLRTVDRRGGNAGSGAAGADQLHEAVSHAAPDALQRLRAVEAMLKAAAHELEQIQSVLLLPFQEPARLTRLDAQNGAERLGHLLRHLDRSPATFPKAPRP